MMKSLRERWKIWLGVAVVLVILAWLLNKCTLPVTNPPPGKIAFVSEQHGRSVIYIMESDGSNKVPLTEELDEAIRPKWSPDGRYIAFKAEQDGDWGLWVMDAGGSNKVHLFDDPYDVHPLWSPDNTHIAFLVQQADGNNEIYVVDREGSNLVNLSNHLAHDTHHVWSPDSIRIAFQSNRDGNREIYVVDRDGSNLVNLTNHPADDGTPDWSPDGTRIAFRSERGSEGIYIMNSDGTDVKWLACGFWPDWSPDSDRIKHWCKDTLYLTDVDGSFQVRIAPRARRHISSGSWAPDGRHLVFWERTRPSLLFDILAPRTYFGIVSSDGSRKMSLGRHVEYSWSSDGQYIVFSRGLVAMEISIMSVDGKRRSRLTYNFHHDGHPVWQPRVP